MWTFVTSQILRWSMSEGSGLKKTVARSGLDAGL